MCFPVPCNRCGKTTWDGCGAHVDEVMAEISIDQRCVCADSRPTG